MHSTEIPGSGLASNRASKALCFTAPRWRRGFVAAIGLLLASLGGCASPAAFSKATPGTQLLNDEVAWLYGAPEAAIEQASASPRPTLGLRVANLVDTYERELRRADEAASAWAPRIFSAATVILPLSGTVGSLVLPSSAANSVGAAAGGATSILAMTSLFYDPREGLQRAEVCATFLRNALDALNQRWDRDALDTIEETPEQWQVYLAMRSGLDAGRLASCPDPDPPRAWWTPWRDDAPEEAAPASLDDTVAPLALPAEASVDVPSEPALDPLTGEAPPLPTDASGEVSNPPVVDPSLEDPSTGPAEPPIEIPDESEILPPRPSPTLPDAPEVESPVLDDAPALEDPLP